MSRATDLQRYIEQTVGRGLRTAVVARVHGTHVDVQVGGSSRYLRGIPVMGEMPSVDQDVVLLEADGSIYAQSLTPPKDQLSSTSVGGGAAGVIGGSGVATQVAFWGNPDTVIGDAGMTYNAGTDTLTVAGNLVVGGTVDGVDVANFGAAQFVTLAASGYMANERVLTPGDGLDLSDGGAGAAVTLAVDVTDILGSGLTESANNIDLDWGAPTIGTIEPDDSANAGASTNPARSDHQHAIVCAAPGANSVSLAASAEGSATSFARSDHTHNLDESITPTWAGAHAFNAGLSIAAGQGVTMADDTWIGIGAALERIVFDTAGDISFMGCNVSIGTTGPVTTLHVEHDAVTINTDGIRIKNSSSNQSWVMSTGIATLNETSFALRDVNQGTYPFVVNATTGNVGIGTVAPAALLDVSSTTFNTVRFHADSDGDSADTDIILQMGIDDPYVTKLRLMYDQGLDVVGLGYAGNNHIVIDSNGNVGIWTTGPDRRCDILDSANPQLRLTHTDGSVYTDFQTDGSGNLYLTLTGTKVNLDADLEFAGAQSITTTAGDLTIAPSGGNFLLDADLDFVGAQSITTSAGDLTIAPTGDLLLDPTGQQVKFANWNSGDSFESSDYISQTTGWAISYGTSGGHADFRSLYADALHVQAFIADIYQALVGGIIVTKSRARISRDFTIPANTNTGTLYVQDLEGWENTQLFTASDVVLLRFVDTSGGGLVVTDVWGVVTNYTDLGGGEQSYTFTTSDDGGVDGSVIYAGAIALDYGQAGSGSRGIWEATVLDAAGAPYSQIATWETNPWTGGNWTTRLRLGNLDGISGIGLEYGLWVGQNTTDTYLLLSDSSFEVHGLDIKLYDGASNTVRLDPATPSIALGATLPTGFGTGDGIWMGKDTVYKFRAGDVDGERIAWDGSDLYIYADNSNYIKATGSDLEFYSGGSKVMWMDGSVGALYIDKYGDMFFSTADGLLLLGPDCPITPTSWMSLRGQAATISGAFHQEAGRWPGTRGLVVEEAGLNYALAPRMYDGDSSGVADGWTTWYDLGSGGTPTYTVAAHPVTERGWLQRVQYTAVAGDANDLIVVYDRTAAASFAATEDCTAAFDVCGSASGVTARVNLRAENAANADLGNVVQAITLTPGLQRVQVTYTNLPATTDHVQVALHVLNVDDGDTIDIRFGAVNVEKKAYATTFCCGVLDWCSWSGAADDSTSTRTATEVNLDAHVGLISANDTLSFRVIVQMPYDADATWPTQFASLMDCRGADNNNRILVIYDYTEDRFEGYVNGAYRLFTAAQTFKAGDWVDLILTLDFASNSYKLYVNGELEDVDTTALTAPTITDWQLGAGYAGGTQGGCNFAEHSVFDRVLTAAEVAAMYTLQRSLVDAGAMDTPGIFIMDGRIDLRTSTTGNRIEFDAGAIRAYDASAVESFVVANSTMDWGTTYTGGGDGQLAAGNVVIGDPDNEHVYIGGAVIRIRDGTTTYTELSAGSLYLGDQSNEHVKVSASGTQIYDGATLYATYGATTTIGLVASEHISISATAVQLKDGATVHVELVGGEGFFGDQANEHLKVSASGVQVYDGATLLATHGASTTFYDTNGADRLVLGTGGVTVGDIDDGEYVTVDATNGLRIYGGNILVGQWDTSGNATFGEVATDQGNMYWNQSNKRVEFRGGANGTVVQAYIDADGKVYAGGGEVVLDTSGLAITEGVGDVNKVKWMTGATEVASLYAQIPGGLPNDGYLDITVSNVDAAHAGMPRLTLTAIYRDQSDEGYIQIKPTRIVMWDKVAIEHSLYVGQTAAADPDDDCIYLDGFVGFMREIADPAAPAANDARVYIKDNGAGKTQLCVRFNTGAVQVLATQP